MKIEISKAPNLLTNGFIKTSGSDGTLSVEALSTNADFTVDPTSLTDRATIKTLVDAGIYQLSEVVDNTGPYIAQAYDCTETDNVPNNSTIIAHISVIAKRGSMNEVYGKEMIAYFKKDGSGTVTEDGSATIVSERNGFSSSLVPTALVSIFTDLIRVTVNINNASHSMSAKVVFRLITHSV